MTELTRLALKRIKEVIEEYDVIVGILPTGYGKSKFLFHNREVFNKLGKVIHVLPLRSIVAKLAEDIRKLDDVGYQAGIIVEDVDKTPFLTSKYTVATFDSFLFNFYGIPVSEIWRSKWHSDVAFLTSRCSHVVLDEVHLVTTPDSIENVAEEFGKIVSVIRDSIKWYCRVGLKTIVFTATLYPWLIKYIIPEECRKTKIIVYAPETHQYYSSIASHASNMDVENFWDERDSFYSDFINYCNYVKTFFHFKRMEDILEETLENVERRRIAVMFNSVMRCIEFFEKYGEAFKRKGFTVAIIHGRMAPEAKREAIKAVKEEKSLVLFATQAVEAGVDVSFDKLVTEVAPPHSLIQRAGRVARYGLKENIRGKSKGKYEIHIVIGGRDLEEGVKKLCGGIYDVGLTLETAKTLLGDAKTESKVVEVNVNWRLPTTNNTWDYLKILCIPGEIEIPRLPNVLSFLNRLTHLRPGLKGRVLRELDEKFGGSFIRTSALTSLYVGPITGTFSREILSKYTIPISVDILRKHYDKILEISEGYIRIAVVVNDKITVVKGPRIGSFIKHPTLSMYDILRKVRRKYGEILGEHVKVIPLGLLGRRNIFNEKWGYIKW